ncbi:MAG TPA: TRAP transporter large permease subunit, partial [Burkholderiales bacterium]|nr:TRAP transporter large permease subunit [Burkholderiales bacterium]
GVLLGVNMQTSFMHPPFGYALFYLRSVAPVREYVDKLSGKRIAPVTTGQIYWGAVPFVVIQVIMVGLVLAFPGLVTGNIEHSKIDPSKVQIEIPQEEPYQNAPPPDFGTPPAAPGAARPEQSAPPSEADPADDLQKQFGGK